jgi:phage recombination protein Bet
MIMSEATATQEAPAPKVQPTAATSLIVRMAERYGVESSGLASTLKATVFKGERDASDHELKALLIVADQYKLNPFTREIYAFLDRNRGVVPIVSVDGWARIVNEHPQFDGCEFNEYGHNEDGTPEIIECKIHRKDRKHPTPVRERLRECKRSSFAWQQSPARMLRHRAFIQCARLAFGFAGIFDDDEGRLILDASATVVPIEGATQTDRVKAALKAKTATAIIDAESEQPSAVSAETTSAAEPQAPDPSASAPTFAFLAEQIRQLDNKTLGDVQIIADSLRKHPQEPELRNLLDNKLAEIAAAASKRKQ